MVNVMKGGGQPRYYSVYSVVGPLKRKNALSKNVSYIDF
jgi:hypothetical protein